MNEIELCLDLLPKRFLEAHWQEFASWSMYHRETRQFKLRWPLGMAPAQSLEQTLTLGRRVASRGARKVLEVYLVGEAAEVYRILNSYVAALIAADVLAEGSIAPAKALADELVEPVAHVAHFPLAGAAADPKRAGE